MVVPTSLRRLAAVGALCAAVVGMSGSPVSADDPIEIQTSKSASTSLGNATLTANIWVETFADSGGCADFEGSAVISGGSAPRSGTDWGRLKVTLDPWGVAPSVTAFGKSGDPISATWTNSNGSRGSYYGGNMCTNFWTLGVNASSTASAYYYGVTRSATASI